jgi:hypothetical protein
VRHSARTIQKEQDIVKIEIFSTLKKICFTWPSTRAKWMGQLIGNFMLGMAYNPAQSLNLISNNYVESSAPKF